MRIAKSLRPVRRCLVATLEAVFVFFVCEEHALFGKGGREERPVSDLQLSIWPPLPCLGFLAVEFLANVRLIVRLDR